MDPDKVLREGSDAMDLFHSSVNEEVRQACLVAVARSFDALDRWIRTGGTLPRAWGGSGGVGTLRQRR